MTNDKEPEVVKVYSSYTPAQKKAVLKYRELNRDKINEQRKQYYTKRMSDPTFLEYKRAKAREYYERKKLKNLEEVKPEVKEEVKVEVVEVIKPIKVKAKKPKTVMEEVKEVPKEEVKVKKSKVKKILIVKDAVELIPIPFPLPPDHDIKPVPDIKVEPVLKEVILEPVVEEVKKEVKKKVKVVPKSISAVIDELVPINGDATPCILDVSSIAIESMDKKKKTKRV